MKKATIISRILLGFIYLVFGLDYFFRFIPYQPNHTGRVAAFKAGLIGVGYFYPMIKSIQIAGGISMLINRYAPFFAVVLFPISLNVFLYHTILVPSGWLMGVLLIVPNLFLGYAYRKYYKGMFVRRPNLWHWDIAYTIGRKKSAIPCFTWISCEGVKYPSLKVDAVFEIFHIRAGFWTITFASFLKFP